MHVNQRSPLGRIWHWLKAIISFITPGRTALKAAGYAILAAAVLFFALTLADFLLSDGVGFGYYLLIFLSRVLPLFVAACLISWGLYLAARTPRSFRIAVAFTIACIFYFFRLNKMVSWILISMLIVFPALIFGALATFKAWRGEAWSRKSRVLTFFSLVVGVVGAGISLYLFLYPGSPVKPVSNYKMLAALPKPIEAGDPSRPGNFKVSFLTYGSGKDKRRAIYGKDASIKTPVADAAFMLKSWSGIYGKLRTWYFGFDASELPLNAMVWYPQNLKAPAPLVLVVHGNHLAQDWSEKGYDYLAALLASRGYIVASVDENFLNTGFTDMPWGGLKDENGARGWLMLKHLELWRKWNQDPGNPFFHKVDMDRIALMGHSRGGEAMSHAALFNTLPCHPDNVSEVFHFNFNIRAYVAIAPVDGQYKPAAILAPLKDINYFVFHGSHDMDMESYGGLSPLYRIQYSPGFKGIKAGLYIGHANHGQFNSLWGKYDGSSPYINANNMTNLMPAEEQQRIAKVYISAFLDLTVKGDSAYKPLFYDSRYGRQWLPEQIYFNQFENSQSTFIARYEEDLNPLTATMPGVLIETANLSVWREAQHKLMWGDILSRAAYIGWNKEGADTLPAKYMFTLSDSSRLQLQGQSLVFSLADSEESSSHVEKGKKAEDGKKKEKPAVKAAKQESGEKKAIDFTLELTDRKGAQIRFLLSECTPLQPQIHKKLMKYSFLTDNDDAESIPDFFYFDLDELQRKHPEFAMDQLKKLSLVFDRSPSGVIILDDVGFTNLR